MSGPGQVYEKTSRFLHRVIDDEAVLVPLVSNIAEVSRIYRLDPVGTWIWEALDGRASAAELLRAQARAFDVAGHDPAEDLSKFLSELVSLGAIREAQG